MKTSVKFVLRTDKTPRSNGYPIALRLIENRKVYYFHTKYRCPLEQWDESTNTVRTKWAYYTVVTEGLTGLLLRVMRELNEGYPAALIVERLRGKTKALPVEANKGLDVRITAYDAVLGHENMLREAGRVKYAESFRCVRNALKQFRPGLLLTEVVPYTLEEFHNFLLKRGAKLAGIWVYMRTLKVVCRALLGENNPFGPKGFSLKRYLKVKPNQRALSAAQLKKVFAYQPRTNNERLAVDIFIFSYYARGVTFKDIALLKRENVTEGVLRYTRTKTDDVFEFPLLPPSLAIWDRYLDRYPKSLYVFPILLQEYTQQQKQLLEWRLQRMNRIVNRALHDVAEVLGMPPFTTYASRHSFGTQLKERGVSTRLISEMYGHETEGVTEKYLRRFSSSTLAQADAKLLD